MNTKLDITELLQKAEELCYDGRIEGAAKATIPVQILESDSGQQYQLSLVMELIREPRVKDLCIVIFDDRRCKATVTDINYEHKTFDVMTSFNEPMYNIPFGKFRHNESI